MAAASVGAEEGEDEAEVTVDVEGVTAEEEEAVVEEATDRGSGRRVITEYPRAHLPGCLRLCSDDVLYIVNYRCFFYSRTKIRDSAIVTACI